MLAGGSIMARKIVVLWGHPDTRPERLSNALAAAYADSAEQAGHEVRRVVIGDLDFPLLRTKEEFESGKVAPGLEGAAEALAWADHIVLAFPLWLGSQPALVKAFLEQVARPGIAFEYAGDSWPRSLWKGKSARIVMTIGMPAFIYRWWFWAHGLRALERNILRFVGVKPVRESLFGGVEQASDEKRQGWLDDMRRRGARGE